MLEGGGGLSRNRSTYHPMYRLRVNMAAMGSVCDSVEDISAPSLLANGSW